MSFEAAEQVADAVLYEGYALYPYRASSTKNQLRWQFGVLMPRDFAERDGSEAWRMQTECLLETPDRPGGARLDVRVRCLQVQTRNVERSDGRGGFERVDELEVDGRRFVSWEEAVERAVDLTDMGLEDLAREGRTLEFELPASETIEPIEDPGGRPRGQVVRRTEVIHGRVDVAAAGMAGGARVTVGVENVTPVPPAPTDSAPVTRADGLRRAMVAVHTLMAVRGGSFVSLIDPPPYLAPAAAACRNVGTWPVLAGDPGSNDLMLSAPIILYDHPRIAPESQGDLFDSTEIDEILTLRVLTLTDEEKAEARATDDRARAILDRSEAIPPEVFARLHGAIRSMDGRGAGAIAAVETAPPAPPAASADPFWEPEARIPPEDAEAEIEGGTVRRGSRVVLRPGRRADAMDQFLAGRIGIVEAVFESVDDEIHVAVSVEDDPAAELNAWYGRYFYFGPEELEVALPAEATRVGGEASP